MGKIQNMDATLRGGLIDLHVLVERQLLRRIDDAAAAFEQNRSAWIRLAMVEKLNRDGR